MSYTQDIYDPKEGFSTILSAASKFNPERFLYAIEFKNWDEKKMQLMIHEVATYRLKMESEYDSLREFAKVFNKEFATINNECYSSAMALLRKIRSGISETKRLFMRFCPQKRRKSVIHTMVERPKSAYDHSRISSDVYQLSLFRFDDYPVCVNDLFNEMTQFFFVLVRCIQLCQDVLDEEANIKRNNKYCKFLFDVFKQNVLNQMADICTVFYRNSEDFTEDHNPAIASRNQYYNDEAWAPVGFHRYTKREVKLLVIKQLLDDEAGSDLTTLEKLLFGNDEKKVHKCRYIIQHFDELIPDDYSRKNLPAKYIQMFFQLVGIPNKLESDAVKYFNETYLSSSAHKFVTVSYQAVNKYKKEVLKDADGSFKAFSEGIKQRFFDTSTLQIASIS